MRIFVESKIYLSKGKVQAYHSIVKSYILTITNEAKKIKIIKL